jgi:serine/threonine protein kinase
VPISNDPNTRALSVDNSGVSSNIGKTLDGRTVKINQQLSTNVQQLLEKNVVEESKGFFAFLANAFTFGKRNVALGQIKNFIRSASNDNTYPTIDPRYEKYLPKSTLPLYKQLQKEIKDSNPLMSLWDSRGRIQQDRVSKTSYYNSADGRYFFKMMPNKTQEPSNAFCTRSIEDSIVTQYKGSFNLNGQKILVFEKAQGEEMHRFLANHSIVNSKDITARARMGAALANSIAVTHEAGFVHRGIQPANVMRVNIDGTEVTKLIDQGFACKSTDQDALLRPVGIRLFMAPECFKKPSSPVSSAVDVYSFGVTLVHTLFNKAPIIDFLSYGFDTILETQAKLEEDKLRLGKLKQKEANGEKLSGEELNEKAGLEETLEVDEEELEALVEFEELLEEESGKELEEENLRLEELKEKFGSNQKFRIKELNNRIKKDVPDCDITFFNRQNFFEKILANPETYKKIFDPKGVYSDDQFKFLCGLIGDCVNPDPSARPSAAQVGYVLEIFAAYMDDNARIEAHNAQPENSDHLLEKVTIPSYQDIMALAKAGRPAKQAQSV